jgi:uncharacterized membrane protein HdeD (DUF308 family)
MARFQVQSLQHLIRGLVILIAGLFLLFMPGVTMQSALMVIGAMMLISGLITLIVSNKTIQIRGFYSLQGIFNMLIGLTFLFAPGAMLKIFVTFFGIILLFLGAIQVIGALAVFSWRRWSFFYFLFALLMLAGGLLLLYYPFKSMETIVSFIGLLLVFYGASQLIPVRSRKNKDYYNGSPVEDIPHEEL